MILYNRMCSYVRSKELFGHLIRVSRAVGYDVIQEYQQGIFRSKPDSSSSQQQ